MQIKRSNLLLFCFCLFLCTACHEKPFANDKSTLRVSCETEPQTLDPRRIRDLASTTTIHMLYEGLMRIQGDGRPALALAESVSISPDQKTYTFKLRPSAWSDGKPVTAQDFEETWKSMLQPQFPCPNAYQLYVIRGAQAAKEGQIPLEQVGVKALDSSTLVVDLEKPTPYFLNLTAAFFFYPVHPLVRQQGLNQDLTSNSDSVTNGPFKLKHWSRHNELTAVPNPYYWDKNKVHLDQITFIILDNPTALQLFQQGDLDWVGSPMSTIPTDSLASLKKSNRLLITPAAGVYLFRINTERPPFDDVDMRQAFALALNRHDLIEHVLQGNQQPALSLIPPSFFKGNPTIQDHDVNHARQLFEKALEKKGLSLANLPRITLCYATGERSHKIAQVAQQQWKDAFGVEVVLQNCESKVYYDNLKNHDYQIGIGAWFADIKDPISFLDVFKYKHNGTNNTQWENERYIALLNLSAQTSQSQQREQLLKDAEQVLMQDMPIIPLFYSSYNYLKDSSLHEVYFSELGYLDFKHAYIEAN